MSCLAALVVVSLLSSRSTNTLDAWQGWYSADAPTEGIFYCDVLSNHGKVEVMVTRRWRLDTWGARASLPENEIPTTPRSHLHSRSPTNPETSLAKWYFPTATYHQGIAFDHQTRTEPVDTPKLRVPFNLNLLGVSKREDRWLLAFNYEHLMLLFAAPLVWKLFMMTRRKSA